MLQRRIRPLHVQRERRGNTLMEELHAATMEKEPLKHTRRG